MICTQWWNGVWCASNDGLAHRGWYAPLATLTELRFHSPGLRGKAPLPWVQFTTNQCYSERVAISRRRYLQRVFLLIYCDKFQLRITPTAKRNSVRVAAACGHLYHVPANPYPSSWTPHQPRAPFQPYPRGKRTSKPP